MRLKISMYLAFVGGVLAPALETIRRWNQISDPYYFISWFDDYIIGGFLLFAAWRTYRSRKEGRKFLIAAWGIAAGMAFYSFFGQLQSLGQVDPAAVSSSTVAVVKGVMLVTCIICLVFSLQESVENR